MKSPFSPALTKELIDCLGNAGVIWILLAIISALFSSGPDSTMVYVWPMLLTLLASGASWALFFVGKDLKSRAFVVPALAFFGMSLAFVPMSHGGHYLDALPLSMVIAVVLPLGCYALWALAMERNKPAG